jgi:protease IV
MNPRKPIPVKSFFTAFFGALFALIVFFGLVFALVSSFISSANQAPDRPEAMVLTLDMRSGFTDSPVSGGLAGLSASPGFTDLILKLDNAAEDPGVKGLYVRAADYGLASAQAEEFRDALKAFQAEGKFVIAQTQGSILGGPAGYRAIAAADEIWMQPGTEFSVPGVSFQSVHLGGAFEKLSVEPEFVQLYEYKGAVDTYTKTGLTAEGRETLEALGNTVWTRSVADIAADRGLSPVATRTLLETSPFAANVALSEGLIDKLGYPAQSRKAARDRAGSEDVAMVALASYEPLPLDPDAPFIALVGGDGAIVMGDGSRGPLDPEMSFASDRIAAAIRAAADDERVRAVVFRVNSPGGDATASDQIWQAVEDVQAEGKPVVVSMGSVAASGGYYVSAGADHIFALDTTVTGSIGVFGGKFAVNEGLDRLGVAIDEVNIGGEFAHAFGPDAFTETQYAAFEAMIVRTYDRFISIVADGRDLSENAARSAARGRVWSGEDARANGLVDARGGLVQAIDKALELADVDTDLRPRVVRYPETKSGFEAFRELLGVSVEVSGPATGLPALLSEDEQALIAEQARRLRAIRQGRVELSAPLLRER